MTMTTKALCAALLTLALPIAAQAQSVSAEDQAKLIENIAEADANSDSALTLAEFETLINLNAEDGLGRAERIRSSGRYARVFNHIDANGDGFLTQTEIQTIAQAARG